METISQYLETMFMNLPKTSEVLRAKEELLNMMEDKYNQLRREGKTENEAVGTVISEFGNLDELASELGILNYMNGKEQNREDGVKKHVVSMIEAKEYIATAIQASKSNMIGVALCICSPIVLIILAGYQEMNTNISEGLAATIGVSTLLILVAIAVAIFIITGTKLSKYEYMTKEILEIDTETEQYVRNQYMIAKEHATPKIVTGVVLCIVAVLPVLIMGAIETTNSEWIDFLTCVAVGAMLGIISFAVCLFIKSGAMTQPCKVLLQEEEYSIKKKETSLAGIVASIYWPIVTCIYLLYSFITMRWAISWVVWPVAGILFGAIAVVCNQIELLRDRRIK